MGLQGVVTCPANRKSDGFDSRIVHQLRYIQQSIINLTQGKSAAERLRRCKSYPRPPLWASSEVDKHSGVVFKCILWICQRSSIGESTCFIRRGLRVRVPPLVPRVRERFFTVRGCSSIGRAAAGSRKLGVRVSSASETVRNIPIPFPVVLPTRR